MRRPFSAGHKIALPVHSSPFVYLGRREQVAHRSLDLAPGLTDENAVAMGEIHRFGMVHEPIEERAESEFRDRSRLLKDYAPRK